jgi:N-acetylglutamate synthase-like GNAT family acetyltransferase
MSAEDFQINKATLSDLEEILALLEASALPVDGVAEQVSAFFVARDSNNRLAGCAAIERHGAIGLLLSVAVAANVQKSGLGSRLVETVLSDAHHEEIKEVVLLTTTARDFFAHRFGFTDTTRKPYEDKLGSSKEWLLPRCSSAVVMSLRLSEEATGC